MPDRVDRAGGWGGVEVAATTAATAATEVVVGWAQARGGRVEDQEEEVGSGEVWVTGAGAATGTPSLRTCRSP